MYCWLYLHHSLQQCLSELLYFSYGVSIITCDVRTLICYYAVIVISLIKLLLHLYVHLSVLYKLLTREQRGIEKLKLM